MSSWWRYISREFSKFNNKCNYSWRSTDALAKVSNIHESRDHDHTLIERENNRVKSNMQERERERPVGWPWLVGIAVIEFLSTEQQNLTEQPEDLAGKAKPGKSLLSLRANFQVRIVNGKGDYSEDLRSHDVHMYVMYSF